MAHTIGPGPNASAIHGVLRPVAVIPVSCREECMDTEARGVLSSKGVTCYIPLAKIMMPLPSMVSSFHSPSYLSPVGQGALTLTQGQPSVPKVPHGHIPLAWVRTPLSFFLPSFQWPSYMSPAGQSAWTLSEGQCLVAHTDHVAHTIGRGKNASAMLLALLELAVIHACRAKCNIMESGSVLMSTGQSGR